MLLLLLETVLFYLYLMYTSEVVIRDLEWVRRRWWTRPDILERRRNTDGAFELTFMYYKHNNSEHFYKFVRMMPAHFEIILGIVRPRLQKFSRRTPLSPQLRLAVTLHYLGHGKSIRSLADTFKIGTSTLYDIIPEVCGVIFEEMEAIYLTFPRGNDWLHISHRFQESWQFPNCLGAIDTKQVHIVKPDNSGSLFWNYTKRFTMGLMAACTADKRFIWANVGSYGSLNDAGVFNHSDLKLGLDNGLIELPNPHVLTRSNIQLPYFFVGDAGFGLERYLMTPYSRIFHPTPEQRIYNYRQSRARRIIECAFGLLKHKWRVYDSPIGFAIPSTERIVLATLCLHNFLITSELNEHEEVRRYAVQGQDNYVSDDQNNEEDEPEANGVQNLFNFEAIHVRNTLARYFTEEGAEDFQYQRI